MDIDHYRVLIARTWVE